MSRLLPITSGKPTNRTERLLRAREGRFFTLRARTDPGSRKRKAPLSKSSSHSLQVCRANSGNRTRNRNRSTTGFSSWSETWKKSSRARTPCYNVSGSLAAASEKTADISKAYRQQERHAKSWCANLGVHAMSVSFEALVHHPDQILPQLARLPRHDRQASRHARLHRSSAISRAQNRSRSKENDSQHGNGATLKSG